MAMLDRQLVQTLPPLTDTTGKFIQRLDADITSIINRTDVNDGKKVMLYSQILQRYNVLLDRRVKASTRMAVVNDDESLPAEAVAAAPVEAPRDVDHLHATVPQTMQVKAKRLMEHLKKDVAWTERSELIHDCK